MWTEEQITAMSDMTGRHLAERTALRARQQNAFQELVNSQTAEMRETAAKLGIPETSGPETNGLPPEMTGPVEVPPDAPVGVPVVIPPPAGAVRTLPGPRPVIPAGTPRPLHLRK